MLISIRNNRKQRKNIKTTIERRRTEQLAADLFFCRLKIHLFVLLFLPRKFYCIRVARIKSPHRTSTGAGHVRTDGITTYFRFSTTTARERTVPARAPPHTPLLELRTRALFLLPPGTSFLPTDSPMLDVRVSFLRHSLRRFPEGNLVPGMHATAAVSNSAMESIRGQWFSPVADGRRLEDGWWMEKNNTTQEHSHRYNTLLLLLMLCCAFFAYFYVFARRWT